MVTTEIIEAILSKDKDRLLEAKTAIKQMLSIKAESFKEGAKKFVAKSIFEGTAFDSDMGGTMIPHKVPDTQSNKGFDQTPDTAMGKDKTGHVFDPDAPVTDAMTGVVGTLNTDPTNSGHPVTPPSSFDASSGVVDKSDAFKRNVAPQDGIDTTIDMLTGKTKGV